MYTTDTPKISVHEFVHEFVAFSWHCVVFYNIAKIANSFVFNGAWYCVALCGLVGFRASLSAINLENQGFAKFVHENVHETPDFNTISGVFYCIFPTDVHERSPAQNRASTLFPGATPGLSQQCGCKVMNLLQNLHDSLKNLFYPIYEWRSFQVKQHRDTKQCNIKDVSPTVRVGRWFLLFVA